MVFFWAIVIYLSFLVGYALFLSRKVKSQEDFAVAGRRLPTFVLFGTLVATWIGTGSIFGHSEKAYNAGIVVFILLLADGLGIPCLYFLSGKVRKLSQYTIQDILETRYNVAARVFGVIALVIAYVTIVSYQYRAAGAILNLAMPSISPDQGKVIAAIFIVGFTITAGLLSVAYTDVIQGVTLILGLLICLPIFWSKAGGIQGVLQSLPEGHLDFFGQLDWIKALGLVLPAFLLILGDANMYQRFFAAKSEGNARKGVFFMFFGVMVVEFAIMLSALAARVLLPEMEIPGRVLAYAARDFLPTVLGVVIFTSVTAIVISTADSYLLSPSTALTRDVYQRFLRKNASPKELLWASRAMVLLLGFVAFILSGMSGEFLKVAFYAYTIYGAGITPSLIAALLWKRATTSGALASIIGGTAVSLFWETAGWATKVPAWLGMESGMEIDTVLPAILVSALLLVGVSFATKPQSQEKLEPFGLNS